MGGPGVRSQGPDLSIWSLPTKTHSHKALPALMVDRDLEVSDFLVQMGRSRLTEGAATPRVTQ